jgi:leucyl-tRNA synthetase
MHLLYARFFVKAMRDMGVFAAAEEVMIEHGRDPAGLFDEPFLMLRNQGQVLGAERIGDRVVVDGEWDQGRLIASSLRVDADASRDAGEAVGELMRRTENLLQVETDTGLVGVEVPVGTTVEIPAIPGTNDVTQLNHHLDIQRMSKSKGNVVNPDELVEKFGSDTVRTHLMFAFEWQKGGPWDERGIAGSRRFIEDVWKLGTAQYMPIEESEKASADLRRKVHQTIAKVDEDMVEFKWNTAVAAMMTLRNTMADSLRAADVSAEAWSEALETLLKLLAPIAPHITEELWHLIDNEDSIHLQVWPESDPTIAAEDVVTMVIQVNGKVRDRIEVSASITEEDATEAALTAEKVQSWLEQGEVRKIIARPPKLINIVVG